MKSEKKDIPGADAAGDIEPADAFVEAEGSMKFGTVDRSLFIAVVTYMSENNLLEQFNQHLEEKAIYDVLVDVDFVNELKRFLLKTKRRDAIPIVTLGCGCSRGGGGGPRGPTGVRG